MKFKNAFSFIAGSLLLAISGLAGAAGVEIQAIPVDEANILEWKHATEFVS